MRCTDSSSRPKSRTLASRPCSAACSVTGPEIVVVSVLGSPLTTRPSNQADQRGPGRPGRICSWVGGSGLPITSPPVRRSAERWRPAGCPHRTSTAPRWRGGGPTRPNAGWPEACPPPAARGDCGRAGRPRGRRPQRPLTSTTPGRWWWVITAVLVSALGPARRASAARSSPVLGAGAVGQAPSLGLAVQCADVLAGECQADVAQDHPDPRWSAQITSTLGAGCARGITRRGPPGGIAHSPGHSCGVQRPAAGSSFRPEGFHRQLHLRVMPCVPGRLSCWGPAIDDGAPSGSTRTPLGS
jgi:hypothetical protein